MAEQLLNFQPAKVVEGTPCPQAAPFLPPDFEMTRFGGKRFPGETPARSLRSVLGSSGRSVILKSQLREKLLEANVQNPESLRAGPLLAGWIEGGRARHALIRADGELWVLKVYRRGGMVGRWNSARYFSCSRFFEELRVADMAERAGVPTAEVLALVIEPAGLGSVRAWLLTRFLPGARPLHEYFGDPFESSIFHAAGRVVASMHHASIDHPDLHLGNIVGSVNAGAAHVHIVDWDRARLRVQGAWNPYNNLARLWRSVEKGRHLGAFGTSARKAGSPDASEQTSKEGDSSLFAARPLRAFIRGYFDGHAGALREARRYLRRRAFFFGVRTWFWRNRK